MTAYVTIRTSFSDLCNPDAVREYRASMDIHGYLARKCDLVAISQKRVQLNGALRSSHGDHING